MKTRHFSGAVAELEVDALVFVGCALAIKPSEAESRRVADLFELGVAPRPAAKGAVQERIGYEGRQRFEALMFERERDDGAFVAMIPGDGGG